MGTIVESIRDALERRDGISEEAMRPLAEAYAAEVVRINERLNEAVGLLNKGLRSEAIQRASLHPNAIDNAAALDFPEIEEWLDVLQFLSIAVPPEINREAALQLNEAIVELLPQESLLRNHRRLAIAKAPLRWRLRVLRHISAADPLNPVWQEDVESWETERLKQISAELLPAIKAQEQEQVSQLLDELTNASWRVKPPQNLVDQARNAHAEFATHAHLTALAKLAPALHEAFGSFDQPQARRLRSDWQQRVAAMKSPLPPELEEQVAPALAWLDEIDHEQQRQDDRLNALAHLENLLQRQTPEGELERAYQLAVRFDEPIPLELEQRYRSTVATRELVAKRKWQAALAGITVLLVLIVGALGGWQWRSSQRQQVTLAANEMRRLLEAQQLPEAGQFFDRLLADQPDVAQSAPLQSLLVELEEQRKTEDLRRQEFENYIALADKPSPADIDLAALVRAEELAANEEEKAVAFKIRRRRTQWQQELQQQQSASLLERLGGATSLLDSLENQTASSSAREQASKVIMQLDTLKTQYPAAGAAAKSQLAVVYSRAQSLRASITDQMASTEVRQIALNNIVEARTLESHATSLRNFVKRVPDSSMTDELQSVADELPLWQQVQDLNAWTRSLRTSVAKGMPPGEARQLQVALDEILAKIQVDESLLSAMTVAETLARVGKREMILDRVFDDLEQATIGELVSFHYPQQNVQPRSVAVGSGNERVCWYFYHSYYQSNPQRFNSGSNSQGGIEVVTHANGAVTTQSFKGAIDVFQEPRDTIRWLVSKKKASRDRILTNWSVEFLKLVSEVLERPNLDGLIKETLVLHLLEGAAEGSGFLEHRLGPALSYLHEDARRDARNKWYQGNVFSSKLAADLSRQLRLELSKVYRESSQEWGMLRAPASLQLAWVGSLLRNDQGTLVVALKNSPQAKSGSLFVAYPSDGSSNTARLVQVGQLENQKVRLESGAAGLVAGRPVFFADQELPHD